MGTGHDGADGQRASDDDGAGATPRSPRDPGHDRRGDGAPHDDPTGGHERVPDVVTGTATGTATGTLDAETGDETGLPNPMTGQHRSDAVSPAGHGSDGGVRSGGAGSGDRAPVDGNRGDLDLAETGTGDAGPTRDDTGDTGPTVGIGGGRLVAPIAWQTVSPELDARMVALARRAQAGDRAARDRLYALFAPRIARHARRFAGDGWRLDPAWDGDDLLQEGYLVFIDLVASWPGGPSFAAYALGYLPWRLRNAVRRLNGPRPRAFPAPAAALAELADHSAEAAEAIVLLETVAAALPTPDGEVLLWRVRDGEAVGVIAARLGISRRTVSRSWHRTITTLRGSLGAGGDDGRKAEGA